jgi:N-acetyl-anhydromuramyl-L-alanine amidase AmpD
MEIIDLVQKLPWHQTRRWNTRSLQKVNKIIVHQTLSEGTIEGVNNYHIKPNHISSRGCPHICYHYGIRKNGEVVKMNEHNHVTWHCRGQNTASIGIMLCGNFNGTGYTLGTSEPSSTQLIHLNKLLKHLCQELNLKPQDVYGHYHFGKPACPGHILQGEVENFRGEQPTQSTASQTVKKTVREIQKRLDQLGLEPGPIDGILGVKTAAAIRRFQKKYHLAVDGIVGPNTWRVLLEKSR